MKFRFKSLLATLFFLPLLFISASANHQLMAAPMPDMAQSSIIKADDCLSLCKVQYQPTVTAVGQRENKRQKEPVSKLAEPYYIQFLQLAPIVGFIIGAAYLLKHLHWRWPNFVKLYANFRF